MPPDTVQQFAARIRAKYPGAYDDLSDQDLTHRILAKYPEYADMVDFNAPKGPILSPQVKPDAANFQYSGDPTTAIMQHIGMPLAVGLSNLHDKLREVQNLTPQGKQAHPIQGAIGDLANKIQGMLTGNEAHPEAGIGTGKYGILNNPISSMLIPGAEGEPALYQGLKAGAGAIQKGISTLRGAQTADQAPGLVKQVLQGKNVAQAPVQAAVRTAAGAEEGTPLLQGNKTILDDALTNLKQQKATAYKQLDDAAGFDLKAERDALKNDQYKLNQLGNTAADQRARTRLQASITDSQQRIAQAEDALKAKGIDPRSADALNTRWKAGLAFKKLLIQNTSADGQAVNVDNFLNGAKKLRFDPKFGDRLTQFFGSPEKADAFMGQLEQAQQQGVHALRVQRIAKIASIIGGYELAGKGLHMLTGGE